MLRYSKSSGLLPCLPMILLYFNPDACMTGELKTSEVWLADACEEGKLALHDAFAGMEKYTPITSAKPFLRYVTVICACGKNVLAL